MIYISFRPACFARNIFAKNNVNQRCRFKAFTLNESLSTTFLWRSTVIDYFYKMAFLSTNWNSNDFGCDVLHV